MKLELEAEEVRELLTLIMDRLAHEAGLPEEDLAKVRHWHGESMRTGSAGMRS